MGICTSVQVIIPGASNGLSGQSDISAYHVAIIDLYQQVEGTMGMCYTHLQELSRQNEDENVGPGTAVAASKSKKLRSNPLFQATMAELEDQRSRGFSVHPKMDLLKTLIIQHFAENLADGGVEERTNEETRAMVFVTFREVVDEIVEALNSERPLIRASKFIGQGTDKQGKKGLAQKEQLEVSMSDLNNPFLTEVIPCRSSRNLKLESLTYWLQLLLEKKGWTLAKLI